MHLIYRKDKLQAVPDAFGRQYGKGQFGSHHGQTAANLQLLAPEDRTADTMSAIIGNTSWTDFKCDECEQNHDILLRLGAAPDYDARWQDLCQSCLAKALVMLLDQPAPGT